MLQHPPPPPSRSVVTRPTHGICCLRGCDKETPFGTKVRSVSFFVWLKTDHARMHTKKSEKGSRNVKTLQGRSNTPGIRVCCRELRSPICTSELPGALETLFETASSTAPTRESAYLAKNASTEREKACFSEKRWISAPRTCYPAVTRH